MKLFLRGQQWPNFQTQWSFLPIAVFLGLSAACRKCVTCLFLKLFTLILEYGTSTACCQLRISMAFPVPGHLSVSVSRSFQFLLYTACQPLSPDLFYDPHPKIWGPYFSSLTWASFSSLQMPPWPWCQGPKFLPLFKYEFPLFPYATISFSIFFHITKPHYLYFWSWKCIWQSSRFLNCGWQSHTRSYNWMEGLQKLWQW